jgi:hypothetical protein
MLVGNVTLRVSKGDREDGEVERWSGGVMERKEAGNSMILRVFQRHAEVKLRFEVVSTVQHSNAPPLHRRIWHGSCSVWDN